jgi:transposase
MRGKPDRQPSLFYAINVEDRIRADHPLRAIKNLVDEDLAGLSRQFEEATATRGGPACRPSGC